MRRLRAGYYTTTLNGFVVDIEYLTTAYGDSGWVVWLTKPGHIRDRSDYPRPTKREALDHARVWADYEETKV